MKRYRADLQLHSCLSPCGSLDNSPLQIARTAVERGVDIIALTDHNSAANCPALAEVISSMAALHAFYGVETTSAEEVHLICLFGTVEEALSFGELTTRHLPARKNDPEYFGDQPVVDAQETICRCEDAFLAGATDLALEQVVAEVHQRQGVILASHVDRSINSIFSQLGIWPAEAGLDGYDVSGRGNLQTWQARIPRHMAAIRSSDAHYLEDIGNQTVWLVMREPTFEEFKLTVRGEAGRRIEW